MPERITGPEDRRLALYRSISDPELARSHGLFVAEGRLVVRRVLGDRRYRVRSVLLNDAAYRDLEPLLDPSVPTLLCQTSDFLAITGFNIHRGCLALVERPAPATVAQVIGAAGCLVVLEDITNADNIGGVFRNAAAFGAGVLLTRGCGDPWYRKAVRTSMGAVLRVPFAYSESWPADLGQLKRSGFTVCALTPRMSAESLDAFAVRTRGSRIAVLAGAEGSGLTSPAQAEADGLVRIPIVEGIDSLNVAVAVGIALFALRSHADPAEPSE